MGFSRNPNEFKLYASIAGGAGKLEPVGVFERGELLDKNEKRPVDFSTGLLAIQTFIASGLKIRIFLD